jgi:DNA-binding HxlR family transcriptional regulator
LLEGTLLTPIETRIIVTMVQSKNDTIRTEEILKKIGIANSTWSAEQAKLVSMGLIDKRLVRTLEGNHISIRMNYRLTEKGKLVGLNLLNIIKILGTEKSQAETRGGLMTDPGKDQMESDVLGATDEASEFGDKIGECVEIALDSFGSNLVTLVKNSLEVEHEILWEDLFKRSDDFESVLRDYFGLEASKKLRKLIAANIKARFDLEDSQNEDLSYLILLARRKAGFLSDKASPRVSTLEGGK